MIGDICADDNSTFYADLAKILEAYVIFHPALNYVGFFCCVTYIFKGPGYDIHRWSPSAAYGRL